MSTHVAGLYRITAFSGRGESVLCYLRSVIFALSWIVATAGVVFAVGFLVLWRRAVAQGRTQRRLWRNTMRSVARGDYNSAATLAALAEGAPHVAVLPASQGEDAQSVNASNDGDWNDSAWNEDWNERARGASVLGDIEAMRRHADERERARRQLEDVLASLQDAVLVVDGESRLRFLNGAALQLFGVRVEDVLGAGLLEALPSFGLEAAVRVALQGGQNTTREVALYIPQMPASMSQTLASQAAISQTHLPQTQTSPMRDAAMRDAAMRDAASSTADAATSSAAFSIARARLDSTRREVFLRVAPVRSGLGHVSGAVAILQDLTEMRRLERVRRDFVANASHELRTPIANIRAGAETILSDPEDSALAARFLPQLVVESERLSRLVSDLLDLAHAESTSETRHAPVDLAAIVRDVMQRLKDKAAKNNVSIYLEDSNANDLATTEETFSSSTSQTATSQTATSQTASRDPFAGVVSHMSTHVRDEEADCENRDAWCVQGDAAGLEQVVFNLLDNALIYTPSGGSVVLRLARKTAVQGDSVHPATSRRLVRLRVSDSGIGIPPEDQERVFERFYRVDKARSRSQGGTGLGLAIVKHIVENHGGHVAVQSEHGRGTTFTVTLPAA